MGLTLSLQRFKAKVVFVHGSFLPLSALVMAAHAQGAIALRVNQTINQTKINA